MKVLAIIGSPRKRNTYETVRQIEAIHKQRARVEYEYLFLKDMDLKLCTGCHLCLMRGEGLCPHKDDRDLIIEKIEGSDGVILASPTHSMNVSWLMKNYFDRTSFIMHRPRFFRQRFMLVTVAGSIRGGKPALRALSFGVYGGKRVGELIALNSPGMNEGKRAKQQRNIKRAAGRFAKAMARPYAPRPTFSYIAWFAAFKAVSEANKDTSVADWEYFKDKDYFIDVRLNPVQRMEMGLLSGLMGWMVRKGYV